MLKKKVYEYEIIIFTISSTVQYSQASLVSIVADRLAKGAVATPPPSTECTIVLLLECITEADSLKTNINITISSSTVVAVSSTMKACAEKAKATIKAMALPKAKAMIISATNKKTVYYYRPEINWAY